MKYRKLRIVWSVAWGLAAAFVLLLWIRSFSSRDSLFLPYSNSQVVRVSSIEGQFATRLIAGDERYEWTLKRAASPGGLTFPGEDLRYRDSYRIRALPWQKTPFAILYVPHWIPLVLTSAVATSAWLPFRFSLRTLLIATTLIAIVLGAIIHFAR